MPSADRLTGRYRRLLLWYPRDYRSQRGQEMVDLLLELAPPGQSRPPVRQRINLIRNGMRCRLGRPASKIVVATAMLACLVCGLFAAAVATRVAWETAEPLPSDTEARAIFAEVLPGNEFDDEIYRSRAMFVINEQPVTLSTVHSVLFGDSGYELGHVFGGVDLPSQDGSSTLALVDVTRLRADGWSIGDEMSDRSNYYVEARKGADIVQVFIMRDSRVDLINVGVNITRATPWAVYPAALAGGALGALAGWLVFGWVSRRLEGRHIVVRGTAIALYVATMVLWWLPIMFFVPLALDFVLTRPRLRWPPMWEWLGQPYMWRFLVAGCVTTLCAMAIAALPRRKPSLATGIARS